MRGFEKYPTKSCLLIGTASHEVDVERCVLDASCVLGIALGLSEKLLLLFLYDRQERDPSDNPLCFQRLFIRHVRKMACATLSV